MGRHMVKDCWYNDRNAGHREDQKSQKRRHVKVVMTLKEEVDPCYVSLKLKDTTKQFLIDTGASVSVIDKETWKELDEPALTPVEGEITAFGDQALQFLGKCKIPVAWKGNSALSELLVYEKCSSLILGRDIMKALHMKVRVGDATYPLEGAKSHTLNAISQENVEAMLVNYESVFLPGIGKCTKAKASLKFKETPEPKFFKPRTVPFAVKAKVEENLQSLVDEGILKPVDHSEWATPLVIVPKKDGRVRICADLKMTVNPQLAIDQYPLPKPDERFHELNGGKQFWKLDLKDAYLQLPLDEESKPYLTINAHKGLFQYQRLPFGVASAPAIFQRTMGQMLAGLEGVIVYLGDITLTAPTVEEHLRRLEEVLKRLKDYGLRVKKEKCEFLRDNIEFLGHVVSAEGSSTLPEKVEAMLKMPAPQNLKEVDSFLGMVQYYGKFIPQLAAMSAPLNALKGREV
ncbi:hypothetical protein L596_028869 [Steinernema carpocapsae]|uniref:Reverse transcriptase domain-containing protein n=1 Tax=Steinernema carpocapsae TaxID=34508 RepID=A0A4U5M0P7_STECR|nr:hypothetical protein L596_028869 [Steinernema carpocapsae]